MESNILIIILCFFVGVCACFYYKLIGVAISNGEVEGNLTKDKTNILRGISISGVFISHIATHTYYGVVSAYDCSIVMKMILYSLTTLGSVCVGVFFFLSGYGNFFSINKLCEKKEKYQWLIKRVKKVVIAYIGCFSFVTVIINLFLGADLTFVEIFQCFIAFKMPGTISWYLKVQLLFYLLTVAVYKIGDNEKNNGVLILLISIIYSLVMNYLKMDNFWWNTALCYSLGIICGENSKKIGIYLDNKKKLLICVGICILFISYSMCILKRTYLYQITSFSIITLCIILLAYFTPVNSHFLIRFIKKLGMSSLELYLIHIGLATWCFPNNRVSYTGCLIYIGFTAMGVICVKYINKQIRTC